MFAARCRSKNVDQFIKFIGIVASIYWSETHALLYSADTVTHSLPNPDDTLVAANNMQRLWRAKYHG